MIEYTTLGNLIAPAKVIRCGKGSFPVLSMTMHDGIVLQSERFKKSLASIDQSDYKVVKRGQLVVGFPIDEGVLYVQKAADEGIMSPAYNVWDIDTEKVDPDFLELCLHSPQSMQYYKDKLRGTTARRRSIPTADLLALKIRLPDMQTQRETVAIMRKAEAVIAARQEQLNSFEQLVKSRFIELFGDPLLYDGRYPKVPLGTLAEVGSSKRIFEKEYVTEGVPFYRTKEIVELSKGNRITTELFITRERYDEIRDEYGIPQQGDLLISAVGTIGVIWIVDGKNDFYFKDGNLLRVAATEKFAPTYLKHLLEALIGVYKQEMSSGTAYAALTISALKEMPVYVVPITEQQQFAAFVEQTDKSKYYSSLSYHLCRQAASYYRQEWMTCRTSNS